MLVSCPDQHALLLPVHCYRCNRLSLTCWFACLFYCHQLQGFAGLWRGVVPAMLRAVPVNAAIFLTVEGTRQLIAESEERIDAVVCKVHGAQAAVA